MFYYQPLYALFLLQLLLTKKLKIFKNGYKIIYFGSDINGCAGNVLDQRLLEDPRCPPADLFRWHFRQAILTNMRGEGEPLLELDFPPNSDMLGQILEAPKAAERLEFEFFDRLAHHVDIT